MKIGGRHRSLDRSLNKKELLRVNLQQHSWTAMTNLIGPAWSTTNKNWTIQTRDCQLTSVGRIGFKDLFDLRAQSLNALSEMVPKVHIICLGMFFLEPA